MPKKAKDRILQKLRKSIVNLEPTDKSEVKPIKGSSNEIQEGVRQIKRYPWFKKPKNDNKLPEGTGHTHHVEHWYKGRVKQEDGGSLTATAAYDDYKKHATKLGRRAHSLPTFGREFQQHVGVQRALIAGKVRYIGVGLKESNEELNELSAQVKSNYRNKAPKSIPTIKKELDKHQRRMIKASVMADESGWGPHRKRWNMVIARSNNKIKSLKAKLKKRMDSGELQTEEIVSLIERVVSLKRRRQLAQQMKRRRSQMNVARKKARSRFANKAALNRRVLKKAKQILRKRVASTCGENYSKLPLAAKIAIDKLVEKKSGLIRKLASRLMPAEKRHETIRLSSARKRITTEKDKKDYTHHHKMSGRKLNK